MERSLAAVLQDEKVNKIKGGIYNKLQVDFAYNSNHIEGSKLTHEQTRFIYETQTVGIEPARVNDVFEAVNHFRCFDFVLDTMKEPLEIDYIKEMHRRLKNGTLSADSKEAVVGGFKKYPNYVGDMKTSSPEHVAENMDSLIKAYNSQKDVTFYEILAFHADFEKIHPFYDGNGRIGRLLMFKECLNHEIVPFFIDDAYKGYYYRGLKEWQTGGEKGFLVDTCLMMQDNMKAILNYFRIDYPKEELTVQEILKKHKISPVSKKENNDYEK